MKVIPIIPRGYCKGVVQAIQLAKKQANQDHDVTILGMIVHNQYIVDALQSLGVKTIDKPGLSRIELLDSIDHGTIIITAHGASQEVTTKAIQKGLTVVDATCPDVIKTHDLIKHYLQDSYEILYIGKNGHPESEGSISIDPTKIHLIESANDIDQLDKTKKYVMTNQTTMSLYDVYNLCEYASSVLEDVIIAKETCTATKVRQEAIAKVDPSVDVLFIIGDPHSNNTKKLASIAREKTNACVYMVETVAQISSDMLAGKHVAAVSSGASTPTYLTNQVIEYLQQFNHDDPSTHQTPRIDLHAIL